MRYAVIIETSQTGYGAYVPDLPGLGVTGASVAEVKKLVREAVTFHLESLREAGESVPEPSALTDEVEVAAAA